MHSLCRLCGTILCMLALCMGTDCDAGAAWDLIMNDGVQRAGDWCSSEGQVGPFCPLWIAWGRRWHALGSIWDQTAGADPMQVTLGLRMPVTLGHNGLST